MQNSLNFLSKFRILTKNHREIIKMMERVEKMFHLLVLVRILIVIVLVSFLKLHLLKTKKSFRKIQIRQGKTEISLVSDILLTQPPFLPLRTTETLNPSINFSIILYESKGCEKKSHQQTQKKIIPSFIHFFKKVYFCKDF